jgi:DnaA family protein
MNRQLLLDVLPAPAPCWANFVVGSNREAVSAARALAPGRALYLWGNAGCGRSHMLRALATGPQALYLNAVAPVAQLHDLAHPESGQAGPRLIAVDDVHLLSSTQQAMLFALYNRWRESAATSQAFALALAGDRSARAMPIREDLRTRLSWDLVFRLEPLTDDDKLAALTAQAQDRQLMLRPEVVQWMLTHHERDIRRLSALLEALDRYSLAAQRPITIALLRTMLADPYAT